MSKYKILIISLSYLHKDPRVIRQYETLKEEYDIVTMGYSALNKITPNILIGRSPLKLVKKIIKGISLYSRWYSQYEKLSTEKFTENENVLNQIDLIVCNDISALELGHTIAKEKIPIWVDLHEYSPRQFENYKKWNTLMKPYVYWQTKKYLPKCQAITTVCAGLAKEYEKEFDVKIDALVYNAPAYEKLVPSEVSTTIKLVHHGGATRHRYLERMIEMMQYLDDNYSLDFYLMANDENSKSYELELKKLSKNQNINFNPPVPTREIARTINKYDIGLFILEPVNFNYLNALPNKIFEFIQARLAIAVTPNPEMKGLVEKYKLGVVADNYSPKDMANKISLLSKDEVVFFKENAHSKAQELSALVSEQTINKIVKKLLKYSSINQDNEE